jgi:pilus assembly protein CpaF
VALDGPYVTIRRFRARAVPLEAFGTDPRLHHLLCWAVRAGWNVLVSGGTSSGKTTLLNALSSALPPRDRVVTIEETAELALAQPHVVRLEARPSNAEGAGGVTLRELVRAALRMRPERIVVGEVRGPEALDMIEALNTGHDGSLSTIHANGPAEALLRLETLALRGGGDLPARAVRAHVVSSIDAVVQVAREPDGPRRIVAVAEVATGATVADAGIPVRDLWTLAGGLLATPHRPPRRFDAPAYGPSSEC